MFLPNIRGSLILSFLLAALFVVAFLYFGRPQEEDALTFPLYSEATGCVRSTFSNIKWIDQSDITYVTFSQNPTSVIAISGFVRVSLRHHEKSRLEPVINTVFHDCYPENISIWKITEPKAQSLQNAMTVLQSELKHDAKRVSLEIDIASDELKYSVWP